METTAITVTEPAENTLKIEGVIKGMAEAEVVKRHLDTLFARKPEKVSLILTETDVLASYLLGYLLNKNLEGNTLTVHAGNSKLIELTKHLNIDKALNITPYQE